MTLKVGQDVMYPSYAGMELEVPACPSRHERRQCSRVRLEVTRGGIASKDSSAKPDPRF